MTQEEFDEIRDNVFKKASRRWFIKDDSSDKTSTTTARPGETEEERLERKAREQRIAEMLKPTIWDHISNFFEHPLNHLP